MQDIAQVKDIMSDKVVSANVDMPILEVAHLITEHHFNGVPVVDKDNKLIGLVTEYNLINEKSLLHLPTLQSVLKSLPVFSKDKGEFQEKIEEVEALKTKDVMDTTPLTLFFDDSFEDAIKLFNEHHRVNPVPVIDHDNKLVGVVSRYDLVKLLKIYGHN